MNKRTLIPLGLALSMLAASAWAQVGDPVPLEPLDAPEEAWVRFVQAAPNATLERWRLEGDAGFVDAMAGDELAFMEVGEYVTIDAGRYSLDAVLRIGGAEPVGLLGGEATEDAESAEDAEDGESADGAQTPVTPALPAASFGPSEQVNVQGEFTFNAGRSYTIVLRGLMVPASLEQGDEADDASNGGGFMGWLRGLFGGGGGSNGDALALQAQVLEDTDTFFESEVGRVRIVHAAPGTDAVDLVPSDGSSSWLNGISYGEASNFRDLRDLVGSLDLRVSGSEVVLFNLDEVRASPNTTYTVILVGTPVEAVPLAIVTATSR